MGFLSALRNFLADKARLDASEDSLERIRDAWGLDSEPGDAARSPIAPGPDAASASAYDRANWRRKLHTVFEKFPATKSEWPGLMTEARALRLDDAWIEDGIVEEFTMMIRGLLADRRLSEDEIARIQAVRLMIGMSEDRAAAVVQSVVADAERFFDGEVVVEG